MENNIIFYDYESFIETISKERDGKTVVLTSGSFDLLHIGHGRYLEQAKSLGDILVVGVDSDEKIQRRKGLNRPFVPGIERYEMLAHTKYVDYVVVKPLHEPKWGLIKALHPEILQLVVGTYQPDKIEALREFCGEVVVLPRQAETSTSQKMRLLTFKGWDTLIEELSIRLPEWMSKFLATQIESMGDQFKEALPKLLREVAEQKKEGENS